MRKGGIIAILAVLAGLLALSAPVAAQGPCDATVSAGDSIQDAIDAASVGDTICVEDGDYDGFEADVNGITVRAASNPVINGTGITSGGQVTAIRVAADDVTIEGFTVDGSYSTGIWVLDGSDDAQILENAVDQTGYDPASLTGVTWDGSAIQSQGDSTLISNNRVKIGPSSKPHNGINVFWHTYVIQKNTVTIFEGPKYQVGINNRGSAVVEGNRVTSPDKSVGTWTRVFGIWFSGGTGTIESNRVLKTDYAVWLHFGTTGNTIERNTLVNNGVGVILEGGSCATASRNQIHNSWWADILDHNPDPSTCPL